MGQVGTEHLETFLQTHVLTQGRASFVRATYVHSAAGVPVWPTTTDVGCLASDPVAPDWTGKVRRFVVAFFCRSLKRRHPGRRSTTVDRQNSATLGL